MSVSDEARFRWFDLGAEALKRQRPQDASAHTEAMYVCPLCVRPFPRSAVVTRELTAEHVPPESFGGRVLVLTCAKCNHTAGTLLDSHAERKERIDAVLSGRLDGVERVKVTKDGITANAELVVSHGEFTARIPDKINRPGTGDHFRGALAGAVLDLETSKFVELGANISWLRSGYLVLFAALGYAYALDAALDIVRRQINNPDSSLMASFGRILPGDWPWTQRSLTKVVEPADHEGWAVQFGRYVVLFPLAGDTTFYQRVGRDVANGDAQHLQAIAEDWPTEPTFGLT
jgi:hypothetical protein